MIYKKTKRDFSFSSFDCQLLIVFIFGMFLQILLPINGIIRIILTVIFVGCLTHFAIRHRQHHQWEWIGVSKKNIFFSVVYCCFLLSLLGTAIANYFNSIKSQYVEFWDIFQAVINIIFELLTSNNPVITFILIVLGILIFQLLYIFKVVYLSEENFLKNCYGVRINFDTHLEQPKTIFLWTKIANFFVSRPFIVQKEIDFIRIKFYKISSQKLKANSSTVSLFFLFFTFLIFGLFVALYNFTRILLVDLPNSSNDLQSTNNISVTILFFGIQVLSLVVLSNFFWNSLIKIFFIEKVIDFKSKELIVGKTVLGFYTQLFSIEHNNLLSLKEKSKPIKISEVRNSSLLIRYRNKEHELVGHLLPEAMDTIQEIYDRYRKSSFTSFYDQTTPLYLTNLSCKMIYE